MFYDIDPTLFRYCVPIISSFKTLTSSKSPRCTISSCATLMTLFRRKWSFVNRDHVPFHGKDPSPLKKGLHFAAIQRYVYCWPLYVNVVFSKETTIQSLITCLHCNDKSCWNEVCICIIMLFHRIKKASSIIGIHFYFGCYRSFIVCNCFWFSFIKKPIIINYM